MKSFKIIFVITVFGALSGCMTVPAETNGAPPVNSTMSKNKKIGGVEGRVVVTSTVTNSNQVDLLVKHLVLPWKMNPHAKTYIVWEVPAGSVMKPQSLGPLIIDKNFSGRLKTVTPFRSFDIFVTAEPALNPMVPTGEKLLWATVTR